MSIRTSRWPAGVPNWADLSVPDLTAVLPFYAAVLGWDYFDAGEDFGGYRIAHIAGNATAGIGPAQDGMPPAWTMYFASEEVDATAAAITANGGRLLMPAFDVGDLGRMCVAADPSGAVFGVWQAITNIGASLTNAPGGLTWEDLRSTDPTAAQVFYQAVFGFTLESLEMAGADYRLFQLPDESFPLGGMGGMMGAPAGTPSHWLVYFGVADTHAAADAAVSAGGAVLAAPFDPPYGTMAALTDPAGAVFWIVSTTGEGTPDRSG